DQTHVKLMLIHPAATSQATGAGMPAAASPAASAVTVDIQGFAYHPATIVVPVGGSVTWTNDDQAPHTVTGVGGAVFKSGTLKHGASFTQTFDTPGTYDYDCIFHPYMKGTVVVN